MKGGLPFHRARAATSAWESKASSTSAKMAVDRVAGGVWDSSWASGAPGKVRAPCCAWVLLAKFGHLCPAGSLRLVPLKACASSVLSSSVA